MITKPTLILDDIKCKQNIARMVEKAKRNNINLRPHFKTHQSLEVGQWFKEVGVSKITVSSVAMANYFASEWNDITIAFPINILEIDQLNKLSEQVSLNLIAVNSESVTYLKEHLKHTVGIFIKIDLGTHRTGILQENTDLIDNILSIIQSSPLLHFKGFLGHAGHTYNCRGQKEIQTVHDKSRAIMKRLKQHYISDYPHIEISLGDTPSCSVAENFEGVDEIRPGNFVFYDVTQAQIGSNTFDQIAVALACPIVAIHCDRNEVVVYGGGVHLSKDSMQNIEGTIYGRIALRNKQSWGSVLKDCYVKKLSQEHGIIKVTDEVLNSISIGDIIYVLPVHSCMTADLMKSYKTTSGDTFSMLTHF